MNEARMCALKGWMNERDITVRAVAERLSMTPSATSALLRKETMPTRRFEALRQLGFPADLLPKPCDQKTGRPAKIPRFPVDENSGQ